MQLTDWQLARLRNALRAYHAYESTYDGERFTWKDVTEAIAEYTGVVVPPERLRQFVEGVRQKDGTYKYTVPKADRLEAIRDFATHADLNLLSEDELEERDVDIQAAMRLLDFLDHDNDRRHGYQRIGFPDDIEGCYWSVQEEAPFIRHLELKFEKPLDKGVAVVHLLERDFDEDQAPGWMEIFTAKWPDECESRTRHSGWAILTPEDNIMIFLKELGVGRNRYYLSLVSTMNRDNDERAPSFTLLHHDYPEDGETFPASGQQDPSVSQFLDNRHRFRHVGQ